GILGNLSITNGTGLDYTTILDTKIGGNVTINNGHGNASGSAGKTWIFNAFAGVPRSLIGGNLSVTYADGNGIGYEGIWDEEVVGNVNLNYGTGNFTLNFDGFQSS